MSKQKIMLIIAADDVSGPAKGIFQIIENINQDNYEIKLFNFSVLGQLPTIFHEEATNKALVVNYFNQKYLNYFGLIKQGLNFIDQYGVDLVQTHGFKPSFIGLALKFLRGIKWICFMHGTTNENVKIKFYNWLDNIFQTSANLTVLVSDAQRKVVYGGHNKSRVKVLHNAVSKNHPMPISPGVKSVRETLNIQEKSKLILCIGRFSAEKGLDIMIEAFAMVLHYVKESHLIIVGDGQDRKSLEMQVNNLKLNENVHFVGYAKTPGDFVNGVDLLALSSRSEGIPNVILESMAMGIPVVATAVGGVPEIIEDGITGKLVPPEKPELLALAIAEVLNDSPLANRLSRAAKQKIHAKFSIEARMSDLEELYDKVLSGKH